MCTDCRQGHTGCMYTSEDMDLSINKQLRRITHDMSGTHTTVLCDANEPHAFHLRCGRDAGKGHRWKSAVLSTGHLMSDSSGFEWPLHFKAKYVVVPGEQWRSEDISCVFWENVLMNWTMYSVYSNYYIVIWPNNVKYSTLQEWLT